MSDAKKTKKNASAAAVASGEHQRSDQSVSIVVDKEEEDEDQKNTKVSISSTFYEQLFILKCFSKIFFLLQLGFVIFSKRKLAQKMLRKCW